jgi:sarcosine oxidase
MGSGVKVALMHQGEETEVDSLDREVSRRDENAVRAMLERYLPSANGPALSAQVCMFTNTPDTHFLIDFHPEAPQTLIASPCSGHGFKFASAIGEILAELLADGRSRLDIDLFRLDRFGAARV